MHANGDSRLKASVGLRRQYSYIISHYSRCRVALGLASCLLLVRTGPYLVMASGHEPLYYTKVVNILYRSVADNGD